MTVQLPGSLQNAAGPAAVDVPELPDLHDRITEAYFGKLGDAFARSTRERIHWICSRVEGSRVLDAGCSQGIASILLGRERKTVVGIDIAKKLIDEAREYLSRESRYVQESVTFLHGDFKTVDLGPERFDTVIMTEVLEHLAKPEAFVEAATDLLNENGTFIVTVPFGINDWPDHKQTFYLLGPWKLLSPMFEIGEVKQFGKWIGFVGRKRATRLANETVPSWNLLAEAEEAFQKLERGLLERAASLSDRVREFQEKLKSANDRNASLTKAKSETDLALKNAEERIASLQAEADGRTELTRQLEKTIEALESRIEKAKADKIADERQLAVLSARLAAAEHTAEQLRADAGRLEQALESERSARTDAEKLTLLADHRHQQVSELLSQTQASLLEKTQEVASLTSRLNQLRAERDDQESVIRGLTADLETVRTGETRRKEEIKRLQLLLDNERNSRKQANKTLRDVERQAEDLSRNLGRSKDHLASKQAQIDSLFASIGELQSEIASRDEKISGLVASLEQTEETALQWLGLLEQRTDELDAEQKRSADLQESLTLSRNRLRAAEEQVSFLEREKIEESHRLAGELEKEKTAAAQIRGSLEEALRQIAASEAEATSLRQTLVNTEEKARRSIIDLESAKKELDTEKGLHRKTISELEAAKAGERSALIRNEDLQRQLQQAGARAMALRSQVQAAEREKAYAESRVIKTRNMISFQLGHALLQAGKSWQGFRTLPGRLLEISRDAKKRREGKAPVEVIPASVPLAPTVTRKAFSAATLKSLKIACVMDDFTYAAFADEAVLSQLTPTYWREELETFIPDLLFIESAWRGKDETWGNKIGHRSSELVSIVEWCRQRKIPTVFWNKEDPVHFETFLNTAALFDHVFTTDIDCIGRYKAALGHQNVWLLPFACPAKRFNPIETHQRKEAFSFAGAYYARYPERNRDLESFISALSEKRKIEIYDRNYGKDDPRYQFPEDFRPFIVGHLPFEEIDKAYKGYTHAINMNSIKQSQSMFARRVFELLGCNTITVSNFSRGVRMLFGDLVVCTDNGAEAMRRLDRISDETTSRKFRLLGLRKVMSEHTAQDRIAYIAAKALARPIPTLLPDILVTAYAKNAEQLETILANYRRQNYSGKNLCVVVPKGIVGPMPQDQDVRIIEAPRLEGLTLSSLVGEAAFIAGMVADDYYGTNYLTDLALATRYFDGQAFGKLSHYIRNQNGEITLSWPGQQYRPAAQIAARSSIVAASLIQHLPVTEWVTSLYTRSLECDRALSIDEFNYFKNGASSTAADLGLVDDLAQVETGLGIRELTALAEAIEPDDRPGKADNSISGAELAAYFKNVRNQNATFAIEGRDWIISSSLQDGKHDYLYASQDLAPAEIGFSDTAKLHLETTPGLNIQLVLAYLDAKKQRVGHDIIQSNHNGVCKLPEDAVFVRLGLRLYGSGTATVKKLLKDHKSAVPSIMMGKAQHLVITNHYPQYDDLYRNGFVHSRLAAYRRAGFQVDVFRCRAGSPLGYHEFENIDIATGGPEALDKMLSSGRYESVGVHFLDPVIWQVLERHIGKIRVNVWVHGAEIQPWHRREYNFRSVDERLAEVARSDQRLAFWRGLLRKMPENLHLVFVSKYFAEEVMEDLGFRLPDEHYSILHNPINTELFSYREKDAGQRKRILSIRTFSTRKYANDLSVDAILALKDKPYFKELEFRLIGDGDLFEETTAPLNGLPNVLLERRFLSQPEIAELQKNYGVFLIPTRWDSQGVSRDEAMASGLVPVTSRVAAVTEFVDETCGYLAEPEDATGLAAAIEDLYQNPEKFLKLSKAAADRVRRQSEARHVIEQEVSLMRGGAMGVVSP